MDKYRVGIVIPALNESSTIKGIINAVRKYGVPIVVDDGSTDNTAEVALSSGAIVIVHEKNRGYDSALNSGFEKAVECGADLIITIDADGQHDPSLIKQFIDCIDAGNDIVIGIRSRRQRFAENLFAWYASLRFGVRDPLCGMKAYRADVYKAQGYFDSYGSIGTELAIFGIKRGFRFDQIWFEVWDRSGQSRFGRMLSSNFKIMRAMMLSFKA